MGKKSKQNVPKNTYYVIKSNIYYADTKEGCLGVLEN